jgi:8-oxo-dGTP pyrophosphatase MutT (NUDIX family)
VTSLPARLALLQETLAPLDAGVPPTELRRAAVLVLFFSRGADVVFLLTERPATLSRHAGQISLPGGAEEQKDDTLLATALRETSEELGMDASRVVMLGRLDSVIVPVSGYLIVPFVGWVDEAPNIQADPGEVELVLEISLDALLDPATVCEETWQMRGEGWIVTYFHLHDRVVWGATARILADLAERFQTSWHGPRPGSMRRPPE